MIIVCMLARTSTDFQQELQSAAYEHTLEWSRPVSFSFSAAEHLGLGFACNVENSVCSPVTCKLCNLVVFINIETVCVVAYC